MLTKTEKKKICICITELGISCRKTSTYNNFCLDNVKFNGCSIVLEHLVNSLRLDEILHTEKVWRSERTQKEEKMVLATNVQCKYFVEEFSDAELWVKPNVNVKTTLENFRVNDNDALTKRNSNSEKVRNVHEHVKSLFPYLRWMSFKSINVWVGKKCECNRILIKKCTSI